MSTTQITEPGWYQDPGTPPQQRMQRYWDGYQWTPQTRQVPWVPPKPATPFMERPFGQRVLIVLGVAAGVAFAFAAYITDYNSSQTSTTTRTGTASGNGAPADEPAGDPTSNYRFNDVQVSEFKTTGHFELRTRVTNRGQAVDSVSFIATIFDGGRVVGVAHGHHTQVLPAGDTVTVEFSSLDDYADFDDVEIRVSYESD